MSYLRVTIEIDGIERRVEKTDFDLADLHPDRRQAEILNLIDAHLLMRFAEHFRVYDSFVEEMRQLRLATRGTEFEEMAADMPSSLRARLSAAGLLK